VDEDNRATPWIASLNDVELHTSAARDSVTRHHVLRSWLCCL